MPAQPDTRACAATPGGAAPGGTARRIADKAAHAAAEAVVDLAGRAPSVHNSQPWRWRVDGPVLNLYADRRRTLGITDPDGRLAILSCGAALHHARVALAAEGHTVEVERLPAPDDPDHLARLTITGTAPVTAAAIRLARAIRVRHTDRRPVTGTPVEAARLSAIVAAVTAEGARLHVLTPEAVLDVAATVSRAQLIEAAEEAWRAELTQWTGGPRPGGTGVPDAAIPDAPTRTTVPGRDFGHPGTLPAGTGHDRAATFAILYGEQDTPLDWLRAGEALSAAWLAATELGVSALPMSAAVEVPATRAALRRLLSGLGEPYLVLRLGIADPDGPPPGTPRLPVERILP